MKKGIRILQKSICIDQERMINCLILVFTENGKVTGTTIVQLPEWFKFWSEKYQYYQLCLN